MASSSVFNLALLTSLLLHSLFTTPNLAHAQAAAIDEAGLKLMTSDPAMEWPGAISLHDGFFGEGAGDGEGEGKEIEEAAGRRSLFWHTIMRYYISYGALSANRVPCPPRSGRSYYTHNCFKVSGPVHPYNRGCSRITRCRR